MATNLGPNVVEDGLVFGLDTGFPLVSESLGSYRFNKGEPTTNKLNDNILGQGNGASLGSDGFGTFIQLADQTTSYSRFQIPNITVVSNETYTWNFELYSSETITKSGNYYFDTNEYSDQFPTSNDQSRLSSTNSCPNSIPANTWTPFRLTVTMKDNLTGAYSYDFFNMLYPGFRNKKIYYRNMQFETKGHKSAYAGQGGTRSVSGSLIELTGTHDINVSNVSYDSNSQIDFDGTDDRIDTSLYHLSGSNHTEEVVVFRGSAGTQQGILSDLQFGFFGLLFLANDKIRYRQMQQNSDGEGGFSYPNVNVDTPDTYGVGTYHIVGSFSSDNGFRLYVNGELKNSNSTDLPFNLSGNRGINHIGVYKSSNASTYSNPFDGKIHIVKCYNRELTANEVQQNFNSLRHRFGL
tara:strand:- start:850 stop:2073 length:1224 start_codon:yes stop_codon:yes gene_type:complete